MTKQNKFNPLNERPRKRNNKKIKNSANVMYVHYSIADYIKQIDALTKTDTNDVYIFSPQHGKKEEMSLTKAIVIVATAILVFALFHLLQRAVDIKALQNCEAYGDCSEVIRDINAK